MDILNRPILERVDWLMERARLHSQEYASPESHLARQRYFALHPTAIVALKCMDGRVNIPIATNTPLGIVTPFRNLGGIFNLGWPYLGEVLTEHVGHVVRQGRRVLMLVTYHFSRSDKRLGCAGFDYDTERAIEHTRLIKRQIEHVFGRGHETVYPLICGFETDEDALILHGSNGGVLDVAQLTPMNQATLVPHLEQLFPDMPTQVRADLLPLVDGNLAHVASVRQQQRLLQLGHNEWMICVGRGFDFIHMPNIALIIGPYSPELADPIRKAATIIEDNMHRGRIPEDGLLLLSSAPFTEYGVDRARAELKACFFAEFAGGVLKREFPHLAQKLVTRIAVMDWRSRALELIEPA